MSDPIKPIVPETMPGVAVAESGTVMLDGPDGVAIAMTSDAAIETGRRLIAAGEQAARQRGRRAD
ncbi:hypothetical protein [Sphingomonas oligophenolica]|uniref:Uncharacterized protein n=1 Tax=Sphingomonas oligophenolica TaxID=301154 RepID=A0A502CI12_9SPHN|nr:hypothetical protein [Sphingomonas oligophenolica]TPG12453.1 hypothetical protein EAH84_09915 [Sphingomonas oligophenolica]